MMAVLVFAILSCQQSVDPEELKERVLSSAEFAEFEEAYRNRGADLMEEKQAERRKFREELEGLSPEEKKERRKALEQQQQEEEQREKENWRLMNERNNRINALLKGEKKLTEEDFKEAVRQIDLELGIGPEATIPARTQRMKAAMAALLEKFPGIREQGADFIKDCLEASEAQPGK